MKRSCVLFLVYGLYSVAAAQDIPRSTSEKPFVIITASYNNALWCAKNLYTIFIQNYHNFRLIYIDDCSSDRTGDLVEDYCTTHPHAFDIKIIRNKKRCYALENLYHAIHSCKDYEIVLLVDGDDFLGETRVLAQLNALYQDPEVLLTYGQSIDFFGGSCGLATPYPPHIIKYNWFRYYLWLCAHPRSFYAGIFKRIKKEDLFDTNGKFFSLAGDVAFMLPMLEMVGHRHVCLSEALYLYNNLNPINDSKLHLADMQRAYAVICSKKPYKPLEEDEINPIYSTPSSALVII